MGYNTSYSGQTLIKTANVFANGNERTLISTDSGKSWKVFSEDIINFFIVYDDDTKQISGYDRWIASFQEGNEYNLNGICYCDDEITWSPTNITTGIWGNYLKVFEDNKTEKSEDRELKILYASSINSDEGIYHSVDAGKTWILDITGNWDQISFVGDDIVAAGKLGAYNISRKEIITTAASKIINGVIVSEEIIYLYKGMTNAQINEITNYIINKIIYPYISFKYTGYYHFPLGTKEETKKYANGTYYLKSSKEFKEVYGTIIDWQNDVGMAKIGDYTLSDLEEQSNEQEEYIPQAIENIEDTNYINTTNKVTKIINDTKTSILKSINDEIDKIKSSGIKDITALSDEETLSGNLAAYNFYVDTAANIAKAIEQKKADTQYTFSEFGIRQIILNAIFEMTHYFDESVRFEIFKRVDRLNKNNIDMEAFNVLTDMKLLTSLEYGVTKVLNLYIKDFNKKVKTVTDNNDKEYISVAVEIYKNYQRANALNDLSDDFNYIIENLKYNNITSTFNDCCSEVRSFINNATPKTEMATFKYQNYDFSEIQATVINEVYYELKEKIEDIPFGISKDDFNELTIGYSDAEITKILNYNKQITEKFKERVLELLTVSAKKILTNNIFKEGQDISNKEDISIKEWLASLTDNNIRIMKNNINAPLLENELKKDLNKTISLLKNDFNANKEII